MVTGTDTGLLRALSVAIGISTVALCQAAPGLIAAQPPVAAARTMLVTVFDRSDRPTVDVGPDDFVVQEGNDEREVLSVQVADYPVTLLIDNGVESPATLDVLRAGARRFIERIGQRPIAIATLADPPVFVASFDDDRAAVLAGLEKIAPAAPAVPGVGDATGVRAATVRPLAALTQAAERISALESSFSVVVVLSAGAVDPLEQPDADRVTPILNSRAVVHVIALRPAGLPMADAAPDLYKVLTDQTRGQFVPIFSPISFPIALQRLAEQLSTEMMVDYLVPPGTSGEDARVGIRIPGARVRGLGVSK